MGSATVRTQGELSAEQISALLDGEFDADQADALLDCLEDAQTQLWRDYHLIGDALRSDELIGTHSESAFLASFSARFASEPHLLAPSALSVAVQHSQAAHAVRVAGGGRNPFLLVRRALPTAAAVAAVAALSWVIVPRIHQNNAGPVTVVAQNSMPSSMQQVSASATAPAAKTSDLIVVRDARLDQYLAAHQQYAPNLVVGQGVSPYIRASAQADE